MYSCILKSDVMNVTLFAVVLLCGRDVFFGRMCVHVCLVCYSGGYNDYTHTVHTVSSKVHSVRLVSEKKSLFMTSFV